MTNVEPKVQHREKNKEVEEEEEGAKPIAVSFHYDPVFPSSYLSRSCNIRRYHMNKYVSTCVLQVHAHRNNLPLR